MPPSTSLQSVAVMVEVCAGSAVLSAEAQRQGFQIFPIDHSHNRFRAAATILVVDLAKPDSRKCLPHLFEAVKPQWCHMGLPCGTCSRARERPVQTALRLAGAPNPRPLRSAEHLFGLPGLTLPNQPESKVQMKFTSPLKFCCFTAFS